MNCSICLEQNPEHKMINCGHSFHKKCIDEWIKIKPICPLCRTLCISEFDYFYKNIFIKKGKITINDNSIIISYIFSLSICKKKILLINFNDIKRIEYNSHIFKIIYYKNSIITTILLNTKYPINIFNICKYHINNSRLI